MATVNVALETSGASLTDSSQAAISGQPLRFSFNRPCLRGAALFIHAKYFCSNTFFKKNAHVYTHMHMMNFFTYWRRVCICVMAHVWMSKDNMPESVLPCYHVSSRDQTQVIYLQNKREILSAIHPVKLSIQNIYKKNLKK